MSTHSHHDHYNPEILSWQELRKDIVYVFSSDILENEKAQESDAFYLSKLQIFQDRNIWIKAFGSTDVGGSFLIKAGDKQIFHAGDLNNWHWNEESTQAEVEEAQAYYLSELQLLANETKSLYLAMFPVDPRLGKDCILGATQFVETIKTELLSPMHFDEEYEKASAFKKVAEKYSCECICWKKKGEQISL